MNSKIEASAHCDRASSIAETISNGVAIINARSRAPPSNHGELADRFAFEWIAVAGGGDAGK